jgi:tetratricopeptide (TPR) repeat protein
MYLQMKLSIPLKDIMLAPGKRFDPAECTEQDVITRIKKLYGVIAEVMDIVIDGGMAHIEFRDATPEKHKEAMEKLRKGVEEAQKGQLAKALNLFKEVLAVIPENVDARRNMARIYLELGNLEKAKEHLYECLQIDPKDDWSSIMLGNIYARNEGNLEVGAFYYEKCLEHHPEDPMVLCNYAALMVEKGEFQKAEILFKKALKIKDVPNAYYGLALLYRMAGQMEAAQSVLETFFTRSPHLEGVERLPIYKEAKELYKELSAATGVQKKGH